MRKLLVHIVCCIHGKSVVWDTHCQQLTCMCTLGVWRQRLLLCQPSTVKLRYIMKNTSTVSRSAVWKICAKKTICPLLRWQRSESLPWNISQNDTFWTFVVLEVEFQHVWHMWNWSTQFLRTEYFSTPSKNGFCVIMTLQNMGSRSIHTSTHRIYSLSMPLSCVLFEPGLELPVQI